MDPRYRLILRFGWGSLLAFFLFVVFIVISDWEDAKDSPLENKRIEIEGSTIFGYREGKKSWEISSAYIWAGRSQFLFRMNEVVDGGLYDDRGVKVLDHLSAKSVKVNSKSQTLIAEQDVSAILVGRQDILTKVQPGESDKSVLIASSRLKYFDTTKKAYLSGKVEIRQGDATILPFDEVRFDVSSNIATIEGGVYYETPEFRVTADRMVIFLDEEYAAFDGNIRAERRVVSYQRFVDEREHQIKSQPIVLSADHLTYTTVSGDVQMVFEGRVSLSQPDKSIRGESVFYDRATDRFEIIKDVVFQSDSLSWLIDRSRKANFENPDFEETISQSVTLNCQALVFYPEKDSLAIRGPLKIQQDDLLMTASRAHYNDHTGLLNFYGRVVVDRKASDKLESSRLSIHVFEEWVSSKENRVEFELDIE